VQYDLGVRVAEKMAPSAFELAALLERERQIAVVTNGDLSVLASNQKGLRFA